MAFDSFITRLYQGVLDQLASRGGTAAPASAGPDVSAYEAALKPGQVPKVPSTFLARPGFGAALRTGGIASAIPSAAGAIAMGVAGGNPLEGADPLMFGRALGEGAARLVLPRSTVEAGDQMGAGGFIGPGGTQAPVRAPAPVTTPSAAELALQARENARDAAMNAPYASPDAAAYSAAQADQSRQAFTQVAPALDQIIGRNTTGTDLGANDRIRNLAASPQALDTFNRMQALNRTGIIASRDANGRLSLTNDPNAQPRVYVGADGKPTSDWTQTEAYQSAIARNIADKAQLADLESKRSLAEARGAIDRRSTVAGKTLATRQYEAELQNQIAERNASRLTAIEGRKAGIEQTKVGLEALKVQAEAGNTMAQQALRAIQLRAVAAAAAGGASASDIAQLAAGRSPPSPYTAVEGAINPAKPNEIPILNRQTGRPQLAVARTPISEANLQASMAAQRLTRAQAIAAYKAAGYDVTGL